MKEKKTSELDQILQTTTTSNFKKYIQQTKEAPSLKDYFSAYIARTGISPSQMIERSNLSRSYGYSILNGTKTNPSRDSILSLCIGAHMDLDTTQHALRIAKLGELYSKVPRDAAIMIHINQHQWNLIEINTFLDQENLELL